MRPNPVSVTLAATVACLLFAVPAVHAQCEGDFNGDNVVTIDELITAVNNGLHGCDLNEPRFVDNGNGTVSDRQTGLMWEQKVPGSECLHCVDRRMDWHVAMSEWLSEVNGFIERPNEPQSGLGGHSDWRIPTLAELMSLADCFPCLNPIFGPTTTCSVMSSTTNASSPRTGVFAGEFIYGTPIGSSKIGGHCVRAVRGVSRPDVFGSASFGLSGAGKGEE